MNRKQRIRARGRRYAFAYALEEITIPAEGGKVRGTNQFVKQPVTADLSWIKPHIQHSTNHRRDPERISTYRRSVYGAPLRILHHKAKYLEHLNPVAINQASLQ